MNYFKLIVIYSVLVLILHVIPTSIETGTQNDNRQEVTLTRNDETDDSAVRYRIPMLRVEIYSIREYHLLHVLGFMPWMILVWFYLNNIDSKGPMRLKQVLLWLCAGLLLAVFTEVIQNWIPYRNYSRVDLILNMAGVMLGALVFLRRPRFYATLKKAGE